MLAQTPCAIPVVFSSILSVSCCHVSSASLCWPLPRRGGGSRRDRPHLALLVDMFMSCGNECSYLVTVIGLAPEKKARNKHTNKPNPNPSPAERIQAEPQALGSDPDPWEASQQLLEGFPGGVLVLTWDFVGFWGWLFGWVFVCWFVSSPTLPTVVSSNNNTNKALKPTTTTEANKEKVRLCLSEP